MNTTVCRAGADGLLDSGTLDAATRELSSGNPVALPTETVYGLAADARNASACAKIFAAKQRPFTDPLICHLPSMDWLERLGVVNDRSRELVTAFWPGPLTLVIPKTPAIPDLVTAGTPTVAVRISSHPVFDQIVRAFDAPLAAPSANRFGKISPTTADHVLGELDGRIPLIIDGGPCSLGLESTILRVTDEILEILRPGPVTAEQLAAFGSVRFASNPRNTPGGMPDHYAPTKPLRILPPGGGVSERERAQAGLLAWLSPRTADWKHVETLSPNQDLAEAGRNFYAALRRLDASPASHLYAESLPHSGLGITLMDRLRRAAHE